MWLALLVPTVLYYGVGASEGTPGLQDDLASRWVFLTTAAVLSGGVLWLGWQIVAGLRVLPAALRNAHGAAAARIEFGLMVAIGTGVLGAVTLLSVLTGSEADDRLITNFHLLDALGDREPAVPR